MNTLHANGQTESITRLDPAHHYAAPSLAKTILELEAALDEAKWLVIGKRWIPASVRISRASDLLKAAQKMDEQQEP